jgi:hypothetical protein
MWRCRHNAYRGDGAFGQFIIVMPDEDAVVAITAETSDMQGEINLVWSYLLPAMHNEKLPANKNIEATLKQRLSSLALPLPAKTEASPIEKNISGKTFSISSNENHGEGISLQFTNNICHLTLKTDTTVYQFAFGSGKWQLGETTKRGPYLVAGAKNNRSGLPAIKIAGAYSWKDPNTLELVLRYIESLHTETTIYHFDQNKILAEIQNSNDPNKKIELKGEIME